MTEWGEYFDAHAASYMEQPYTFGTFDEVDFVFRHLRLTEGASVLDVGCGTGRHSVELARRGCRVTGMDISAGMLAEGARAAAAAGVEVQWVQADARTFEVSGHFDAAICLCEGAFCLIGSDDDPSVADAAILDRVCAALRPGAMFILTALNGLRRIRACTEDDVDAGRFDPVNMVDTAVVACGTAVGTAMVSVRERSYVPSELALMLRYAGFAVEHVWGGTAGGFGERRPQLDEMEVMYVCRKVGGPADTE